MSHKANILSPPGTHFQDRTVGELVAEHPGLSRVFQSCGIDFCCQGGRTLRDACQRKGLALPEVIDQLQAELRQKPAPQNNPAELPLDELADYIVQKHHSFLRRELPRLHAMSARVAQVHGGHNPALVEMDEVFQALESELTSHLAKEEQILFPAVAALSRGETSGLCLDGPIACMLHEHDDAGAALSRLRELSHGFQPPSEACNTYRALFAGLQDLEDDLHRHIHLENSVLFPAAQALTKEAIS
jgi:regulator of cell morphogenesis and NO signaling